MTTKEQEREALEKIKAIVEELGENSYVATAFEGCFEIAEQNIEYDAADSFKGLFEAAAKKAEELRRTGEHYAEEIERLHAEFEAAQTENIALKDKLDSMLKWEECSDMGTKLKQSEYERLENSVSTEQLTNEKAKEILSREFGFDPEKIEIINEVSTFESCKAINRIRIKEKIKRIPLYDATDWNYIRFNCSNWYYEMIDGQLYQYYC